MESFSSTGHTLDRGGSLERVNLMHRWIDGPGSRCSCSTIVLWNFLLYAIGFFLKSILPLKREPAWHHRNHFLLAVIVGSFTPLRFRHSDKKTNVELQHLFRSDAFFLAVLDVPDDQLHTS